MLQVLQMKQWFGSDREDSWSLKAKFNLKGFGGYEKYIPVSKINTDYPLFHLPAGASTDTLQSNIPSH